MVNNTTLATIAVLHGFHKHLQIASKDLDESFVVFESQVQQLRAKEKEKARQEQRPMGQYWRDLSPPKVRTMAFGTLKCSAPA